jgi:2-(1,2-epoxy-1,2-dihydrophenyl)acetyl-CoA isomerase
VAAEVLTEQQGAVLTITLNRPEVFNALTRTLLTELREALDAAATRAIRCVVLTGAGKGFCAGQDLHEFEELSASVADALEETYHPVVRGIRALDKPVICALNGVTAGAGLSLAMACDVRVAAESASLVPGFIAIGLVPDAGGTWFLQRQLGFARAFEWMCSNRRLLATEALEWGLVSEVIADEAFPARVAALATEWAKRPTVAVAATKRLLDHAATAGLEEQLALESMLQQRAVGTRDFAEGVSAFLEKRPGRFSGE